MEIIKKSNMVQILLLLALAYAFGYYIFTGSMYNLLAPRLIYFTYFAFAFITILLIYNIRKETPGLVDWFSAAMVGFFFMLVVFIPPGTLDTSVIEVKGGASEPINSSALLAIAVGNETIEPTGTMWPFTPDTWQPNHLELYNQPEKNLGKTVTLSGFVYKKEGMYQDRLFIGRYVIWCCVADAYPITILIESDKATQFNNDDWVQVEGILSLTTVANTSYVYPVIIADKIEKMPEQRPYVYFKSFS